MASATLAGPAPDDAVGAYRQLKRGEYAQAVNLPSGGVEFSLDVGSWHLQSGTVRLMRPVDLPVEGAAGPMPTGLVFEGSGRFRLQVPDPVELGQLRRMAENESLQGLDVGFDRMVMRFAEPQVARVMAFAAGGSDFAPDPEAAERHEHWLEDRRQDLDARVVAALLSDGDSYLRAAMETQEYAWIEFLYDGLEGEELSLAVYRPRYGYLEEWVRLDQAADRGPDGRPASDVKLRLDRQHFDAEVDLTVAAKALSPLGKGEIQPRLAEFTVTSTWTVRRDLGHALSLVLSPLASVRRVERVGGDGMAAEVPFLRHQLDKSVSLISEDYNDRELVVLLDEPVAAGETLTLRFAYELEVLNYVSDVGWHPGEAEAILDPSTSELRLRTRKRDEVRAMGATLVSGDVAPEDDSQRLWQYRIDRPTSMVTFSFAETFHEETVEQDGVPGVTAFANYGGRKVRNKAYNVAADVSNSLGYFQQLFQRGLPTEHLYATSIYASHGQSYDGFLHLAESTFLSETEGPTEMFRAHEAAHQWWGHTVVPATYRDQWLAEAFAEYSAILFLQVALDDGAEVYEEIIEAYSGVVQGRYSKASKFLRNWAMQDNDQLRRRVGPIGLGYRAATSETPVAYFTQTYMKGAVVLHMLRTCLRSLTRSDETFFDILRDFLDSYAGRPATTADFLGVVERNAPGAWGWFFDQWIQGTAIPTYRWSHQIVQRDGKVFLDLDIEQSGVPADFRMPVPVQLDFGKGQQAEVIVMVDEPHERASFELPARPKAVTLNGHFAVLADVKAKP